MVKRKWLIRLKMVFFAVLLVSPVIFGSDFCYAASEDGADEDSRMAMDIEQNIMSKRAKSPVIQMKQTVESQIPKPILPSGKTLIQEINVIGSTLLAQEAIDKIKKDYENKELTGRQMQKVADLVTRAYSREGYITSYGYLDTSDLSSGVLVIKVAEGKTGSVTIQGNKYFSTKLIRKKITLKEGGYFNFNDLNIDIFRLNKHADLKASIVCDPDVKTGITDVVINVKDKSPLHVMLQVDNYGSEYILQNRYKTFFIHNNLTGHDDTYTIKLQRTEADAHQLYDMEYVIPINNKLKFDFYYMPYKVEDYYYADNEQTDFEKHARKFYFYFNHAVIDKPGVSLNQLFGFKYFDIHWYTGGGDRDWESSFKEDRFRSVWWQLDLNRADRYGRWIVSNAIEKGIPGMWGGSPRKSDQTSVNGGGNGYWKENLYIARRQKLVAGIDFIGKMRMQLSSQSQPGVNVFGLGGFMGVVDNRGYPRAQAPGDSGIAFTSGFSMPPFGVSKSLKVPFSKTNLYDAVKFFTFYDWGRAELRNPGANEQKVTTLGSAGCGVTVSVPDKNLSMRLDIGWPVTSTIPKDQSDHSPNFWWAITKVF